MLPLESIHDVGVPIPIGQSVAELFLMYYDLLEFDHELQRHGHILYILRHLQYK